MLNNKLAAKLVALLLEKNLQISQAESCTGGLLSKYITDQPGASSAFECGIVSYSGAIKHRILGVSMDAIRQYGEVSEEVACQMADGVRCLSGADIGIGITGIAGPGGGSAEKPVGLVYFAVSYAGQCIAHRLELFDCRNRSEIREQTVTEVLTSVLNLIK